MKKRTKEIERDQDDNTTSETETDIGAEVKEERNSSKSALASKPTTNGLNLGAIFIMLLFGLPMVITGVIYVRIDYFSSSSKFFVTSFMFVIRRPTTYTLKLPKRENCVKKL